MNTNSSRRETDANHQPKGSGARSGTNPTAYQQTLIELCRTKGGPDSDEFPKEFPKRSFLASDVSDQFIFCFPPSLPLGDSVSISSSRLGQKLDQQVDWFDAIRTLAVQLQGRKKFLITSHGTTTHQFVTRIAALFGIPLIELKPFPDDADEKWFERIAQTEEKIVWFQQIQSAEVESGTGTSSKPDKKFNVDDLLVSISRCAILLSVRKSGKILAAANRRLEFLIKETSADNSQQKLNEISDNGSNAPVTKLLINRKLTAQKTEANLLSKGASGWWLYRPDSLDSNAPRFAQAHAAQSSKPQTIEPVILEPEEVAENQFLLHWTRRRVGPWPDQTQNSFLDDLIFRNSRRNHSELSSLCRILALRRILGSANLTRSAKPVVCFSDLTIQQLKKRRVFRPHLSRWDFEPYGLGIDRELLEELGARRVVYGDESSWDSLSPSVRPFFQTRRSANQKIDWQIEQEWRIVGDLRLELIPHDRAFVFVASEEQANVVASLCHWPIVVMDSLKEEEEEES